jgi:hypothetical protein
MASGIIFYDDEYVLSGLKAYGEIKDHWTGIGGKIEEKEMPMQAAIRETLEELYGIYDQPDLIAKLLRKYKPKNVYRSRVYTLYSAPIELIFYISEFLLEQGITSTPHYANLPFDYNEIVSNYKSTRNSEFKKLDFVKRYEDDAHKLDTYFFQDIDLINRKGI